MAGAFQDLADHQLVCRVILRDENVEAEHLLWDDSRLASHLSRESDAQERLEFDHAAGQLADAAKPAHLQERRRPCLVALQDDEAVPLRPDVEHLRCSCRGRKILTHHHDMAPRLPAERAQMIASRFQIRQRHDVETAFSRQLHDLRWAADQEQRPRRKAPGRQHLAGEFEPEQTALPRRAFDADAAAMGLDDLLGDGEAEAGSAVPVDDGLVGLGKLTEDLVEILRRDADATVMHVEAEGRSTSGASAHADMNEHEAGVGELHGVSGEVDEDFLQMPDGNRDPLRRLRRKMQCHPDALRLGLDGEHVAHRREMLMKIDLFLRGGLLADLHARHVEQGVDERQKRAARPADRVRHLELFRRKPAVGQQVAEGDDGVQRRPQFVADTGEEHRLRLAGLFRDPLGQRELADQCGHIEGQDDQAEQQADAQRQVRLPESCLRDDQCKGHNRQRRGSEEIADAETEAIAEDRPEIDGIDHGRRLAPDIEDPRTVQDVEGHADETARHANTWVDQQMGEHGQGHDLEHDEMQDVIVQHLTAEDVEAPGNQQIDEDHLRQQNTVEDDFVFAVGPIVQAMAKPGPGLCDPPPCPVCCRVAAHPWPQALRATPDTLANNARNSTAGMGLPKW